MAKIGRFLGGPKIGPKRRLVKNKQDPEVDTTSAVGRGLKRTIQWYIDNKPLWSRQLFMRRIPILTAKWNTTKPEETIRSSALNDLRQVRPRRLRRISPIAGARALGL